MKFIVIKNKKKEIYSHFIPVKFIVIAEFIVLAEKRMTKNPQSSQSQMSKVVSGAVSKVVSKPKQQQGHIIDLDLDDEAAGINKKVRQIREIGNLTSTEFLLYELSVAQVWAL